MGGMQATIKVAVVQSILFIIGVIALGMITLHLIGDFETLNRGLAEIAQNLPNHSEGTKGMGGGKFPGYFSIPGVIQFTDGLGLETPQGGAWTAIMIFTFILSFLGIQSSPAFTMLGFASKSSKGFAINQVWGSAACVGFVVLVFCTLQGVGANLLGASAPVNVAGMAVNQVLPELSNGNYTELCIYYIKIIGINYPWLSGFIAVCAIASLQVTATAFMSTTGNILCKDVYMEFFNKSATFEKQMKVARFSTGLVALFGLLLASFSLNATVLLGSLAIACSFQLWPSLLGITWFRWMTKGAATAGLTVGIIVVILTEPLGQQITGGSLPWGVWPWNIHSAVWGIFFNIIACLTVLATTSDNIDQQHRNTFHAFFLEYSSPNQNDRWSKPASGILLVIWLFFAIGPGSIFGNFAFGVPNKGYDFWLLGVPSIWGWQIIWWALGVALVWFVVSKAKISTDLDREIIMKNKTD